MRIVRIEVDGFGRFSAAGWELAKGLSVFIGPNEAGKTTLMNAVRAILFGFEPSRGDRAWYPAFEGGRRGGRMVLEMARGDVWTIERHSERGGTGALQVRAPNGNRGGQETLDRLLAGASKEVFANVFAFGLGELQSLESLSGEGVRGRIYGAGAGLGGTSVVDVERALRQQQDEAFKARGQKRINDLLGEIEEHHARIRELEAEPAEYDARHARMATLRDELRALQEEQRTLLEESARLSRLERARPFVGELRSVEAELALGDPADESLPVDAVERWERRRDGVEAARRALAETSTAIERTSLRMDQLAVDEGVLREAGEIAALRDERQVRARRAAERSERHAVIARHAAEVDEQLRRLGPGWDETRLVTIDDSIATVQTVAELGRARDQARSSADASRRRVEALDAEIESRAAELADGSGEEADEERISARAAALAELRDAHATLRILEERLRGLEERRADADAPATPQAGTTAAPSRLVPAAALGAAGLALGALVGTYLGSAFVGVIVAVVLAVALAFGYLQWPRIAPGHAEPPVADGAPGRARRRDQLERLDGDIDTARRERDRVAQEIGTLESRAGVPAAADPATLRLLGDELVETRARLVQRRGIETRLARLRERREEAARDLVTAEAAEASADDRWSSWLVERGLDRALSAEAARQVIEAAGAARRSASHRDAALAITAREDAEEIDLERRVAEVLARLGRNHNGNGSHATTPGAAVDTLVTELDRSLANRRARRELEAELAVLQSGREAQHAELARVEGEAAAWLGTCGVASEDELRDRAARAASRRALVARRREAIEKLEVLVGGAAEGGVEATRADVERTDPAVAEASAAQVAGRLQEIDEEIGARQREEGALRGRIVELEASDELGRRRQALSVLEATAAQEARDWAVRAIALRLLEETRARYERERQPQVIRDAERYFSLITGGRYTAIVAAPGEASVRVDEGERLRQKDPDELSRGTQEQLYLALRFGLIEQFARTAEALPVVMDDILVNFDAERAGRAAEAIRELARSHQVIYFTCHEPTAKLLDPSGKQTSVLG